MEKYSFPTEPLIQEYPYLKDIQFYRSKELTSKTLDFRLQIRNKIYNKLFLSNFPDWMTDLDILPETDEYSISISHCPSYSGFACIKKPLSIGIDIESAERMKAPLIERISSAEERAKLLTPSYIWSAKEAAWKACQKTHSIEVMSQIETCEWRQVKPHTLQFKVQFNGKKLDGIGLCVLEEDTFLAFYVLDSTFIGKNRQK